VDVVLNNEAMTINELTVSVENALQEIRPYLETDGGNISLVEITEDTVCIQLEGACLGCSVNQMTLKNGVEATIKRYAPQIKRVIEVNGITF
jgi:Fe-S cluster biogenesis protein NfuA